MSTKLRRVLIKINGQTPGLLTIVMDYLADIKTSVERLLDDHGIDYEEKGYKIISDNYNG